MGKDDYFKRMRNGDISGHDILASKATYSTAEVRAALEQGLPKRIDQCQNNTGPHWEALQRTLEQVLDDIKGGKETTLFSVDIPAP